jgi:hypothetical protein
MLVQETEQLGAIASFGVMPFLFADILAHWIYLRFANGERGVAVLPSEVCQVGPVLVHPFGGACFDIPQGVGQCDFGRQYCKDVEVVSRSVDLDAESADAANDSRNVLVQVFFNRFGDEPLTAFGAEDEVVLEFCVRAGQDVVFQLGDVEGGTIADIVTRANASRYKFLGGNVAAARLRACAGAGDRGLRPRLSAAAASRLR